MDNAYGIQIFGVFNCHRLKPVVTVWFTPGGVLSYKPITKLPQARRLRQFMGFWL